jgi:hypothetical protein
MTLSQVKMVAVFAFGLSTAALTSGCSIEPSAPGQPTYEADVRPILMARCIRCHGSPPLADPTSTSAAYKVPPVPTRRFDVFADTSCGTPDGGGSACVILGAQSSAAAIKLYINFDPKTTGMPPAPAPPLTSYQKDTIMNWAAEMPAPLEN